jgi:hypothetical protein
VSGADADYVVMRSDMRSASDARVNPYRMAFEGYANNVLVRHFPGELPPWLHLGMRAILGNTLVRAKDVEIGRAIPWYVDELTGRATASSGGARSTEEARAEDRRTLAPGTSAVLPLDRLVAVTRDDPEYTGESARRLLGAQSWAFVHFLMFGDGGTHRAKFNRLANALRQGAAPDQAVREALGDVSAYTKGFRAHVGARAMPFQRAAVDIDVAREKWPARTLPAAEEAARRAKFAVSMDDRALAREKVAAARAADPALAAVSEAEGLLLAREGDNEGAQAAFRRAREQGATSAWLAERLDGRPAAAAAARGAAPAAAGAQPANVDHLIGACNKGDEEACKRMAETLTRACDMGDAASCMPLGWLYVKGRGVAQDVAQGEYLYERACEGGEPRACLALARSIEGRSQAPVDRMRAAELTAKACAAGVAAACPAGKKD